MRFLKEGREYRLPGLLYVDDLVLDIFKNDEKIFCSSMEKERSGAK